MPVIKIPQLPYKMVITNNKSLFLTFTFVSDLHLRDTDFYFLHVTLSFCANHFKIHLLRFDNEQKEKLLYLTYDLYV